MEKRRRQVGQGMRASESLSGIAPNTGMSVCTCQRALCQARNHPQDTDKSAHTKKTTPCISPAHTLRWQARPSRACGAVSAAWPLSRSAVCGWARCMWRDTAHHSARLLATGSLPRANCAGLLASAHTHTHTPHKNQSLSQTHADRALRFSQPASSSLTTDSDKHCSFSSRKTDARERRGGSRIEDQSCPLGSVSPTRSGANGVASRRKMGSDSPLCS
jgi:hypothetical protein